MFPHFLKNLGQRFLLRIKDSETSECFGRYLMENHIQLFKYGEKQIASIGHHKTRLIGEAIEIE